MANTQTRNGKAFEYAIATSYYDYLSKAGIDVTLEKNSAYMVTKNNFDDLTTNEQNRFVEAAHQTIPTMLVIESGLYIPINNESLNISIASDSAGKNGDVRDVLFSRKYGRKEWAIGFSAKNNHNAVKHSRMSESIDFGKKWLGFNCHPKYKNTMTHIFDTLQPADSKLWRNLLTPEEKGKKLYAPMMENFQNEMQLLYNEFGATVPQRLLHYLIGRYPFYKIVKEDRYNQVIVKAFNVNGGLNKMTSKGKHPVKVQSIKLPERIISFDFKPNSQNTLLMVLDKGWQVSFRIHTANSKFERSLKFDINLIGNPPVLFTQHLFATKIPKPV